MLSRRIATQGLDDCQNRPNKPLRTFRIATLYFRLSIGGAELCARPVVGAVALQGYTSR